MECWDAWELRTDRNTEGNAIFWEKSKIVYLTHTYTETQTDFLPADFWLLVRGHALEYMGPL